MVRRQIAEYAGQREVQAGESDSVCAWIFGAIAER